MKKGSNLLAPITAVFAISSAGYIGLTHQKQTKAQVETQAQPQVQQAQQQQTQQIQTGHAAKPVTQVLLAKPIAQKSTATSIPVATRANMSINTGATAQPATVQHTLNFDNHPQARKISISKKTYNNSTDGIFKDGLGREVLFRGWNTSGAVKLVSTGFKPFMSRMDADKAFSAIGQKAGSNQIRFTIAWEGVHPAPDVIDYAYLEAIVEQMREAIKRRMYIVVDYHSDLYSRHTFTKNSKNTGNGAPRWIVKGGNHGTDSCGLPCLITWGAHKLSDPAVRSAVRAFWLNSPIITSKGKRHVQDEFLWQMGKVTEYLNQNLSAQERDYILGIEPLNEPFDGGIKELGLKNYSEFDNKILWPFYQRARTVMNQNGMSDKSVYAEPLVFWYTTTGMIAKATGRKYLKNPPGEGFVFAPHMYDQGRMGVNEPNLAKNAAYLYKLDEARDEARFLGNIPVFLGEYGMWLGSKGVQDTSRIITGSIQALETSENSRQKDRFVDFYTPWIHGAQWHWNHYYDKSKEYLNQDTNKVITKHDAWNNENFSAVKNYSNEYNHQQNSVERVYPRRIQGELMHFAYNALTTDNDNKPLNWLALRVDLAHEFLNREYFRDRKFALTVWRGRKSDAPTEIFQPRSFYPERTTVITEKVIKQGLKLATTPANTANEVLLTHDPAQAAGGGHRLLVWDDVDTDENSNTIHFALQVEHTTDMTPGQLKDLQQALKQRLQNEKRSPIYLTGEMTFGGYAPDSQAHSHFQMIDQRSKKCLDVAGANPSNGSRAQIYDCNGTNAQRWQYNKATGRITTLLDKSKCLTVAGSVQQGATLEIRQCTQNLNARQQFDRLGNWRFATRTNQALVVDAFGTGNSISAGLWTAHSGANQSWAVRY